MGVTVRQKVKGRGKPWWVFVCHNYKRTSKLIGDKQAAETVASQIRAKIQLGEFQFEEEKPVPTFKEYADSWIKTTVPATCKASTVRSYQDILRLHVGPVFNDISITEITRGQIKDFLLGKLVNEGKARSTVSHMKDCMSGIFARAVDDELLPANPVLTLGRGFLKDTKTNKNIDPLEAYELGWLLRVVDALYPEHYALFLTLARTGLRIGEALALQWAHIDFHSRFIKVEQGLSRGKMETPKSGKTRRVDVSKQLAAALRELKTKRKRQALQNGWGSVPEWIFINRDGKPIDLDNWRHRVFNKALEKAELRRVRIHDLRHTYATLRISKGDNIQDVSNQLGHHSTKLTLDVYSHWMPGKKKSEVDALDDLESLDSSAPYLHPGPSDHKKRATGNPVTL